MPPQAAWPKTELARAWFVILAVSAISLLYLVPLTGFPRPIEITANDGFLPDAVYDWMLSRAAWDGYGSYRPLSELAQHYSLPRVAVRVPNPRPPGGVLVLSPIALGAPEQAMHWVNLASFCGLVALLWFTARTVGRPPWLVVALVPVVVWLARDGWLFGSHTLFVSGLVAAGWYLGKERSPGWAGACVGIAAAIKMWPLLIVASWVLLRRHRAALVAAATAGVLNGFALLLPGVGLEDSLLALVRGGTFFARSTQNTSLAAWLIISGVSPLLAAAFVGPWWAYLGIRGSLTYDQVVAVTIVGALLLSPVASWNYWWVCAPAVGVIIRSPRNSLAVSLAVSAMLIWLVSPAIDYGRLGLFSLPAGVLLAVALSLRPPDPITVNAG